MMRAIQSCHDIDGEGKLYINEGDQIVVIEGEPEHHWWKGQNQTTFNIGYFPRYLLPTRFIL